MNRLHSLYFKCLVYCKLRKNDHTSELGSLVSTILLPLFSLVGPANSPFFPTPHQWSWQWCELLSVHSTQSWQLKEEQGHLVHLLLFLLPSGCGTLSCQGFVQHSSFLLPRKTSESLTVVAAGERRLVSTNIAVCLLSQIWLALHPSLSGNDGTGPLAANRVLPALTELCLQKNSSSGGFQTGRALCFKGALGLVSVGPFINLPWICPVYSCFLPHLGFPSSAVCNA